MKIIIVDDEEDIQILFMQRFHRECKNGKIQFHFALSAEEALEYLNNTDINKVNLVFSDINMPGMNGFEFLKILRDKFATLKVVMVTAYGNENYYQTAMQYGATDYLTKPLNFNSLKERFFNPEHSKE